MKIDDLEEGVEFNERINVRPIKVRPINARPQFRFPETTYDALPVQCGWPHPQAISILSFGGFAVRTAELAVGPRCTTAVCVRAFFSLAAFHISLLCGTLRRRDDSRNECRPGDPLTNNTSTTLLVAARHLSCHRLSWLLP